MDINDILTDTTNAQKYWARRDDQLLKDREILQLTKPTAKTDKIQWVSNEPKVFYDTAVALISSYPPRFRLPLTINYTPEEKDKMNKAERFLLGILRSLDHRQLSRGQIYWLREWLTGCFLVGMLFSQWLEKMITGLTLSPTALTLSLFILNGIVMG